MCKDCKKLRAQVKEVGKGVIPESTMLKIILGRGGLKKTRNIAAIIKEQILRESKRGYMGEEV